MRVARGITLTEALVVTVGLSCMTAVMVPALMDAKDAADETVCAAHLAQLGQALRFYAQEREGYLPDCGAASPLGGAVPADGRHYGSRFDAPGTMRWPEERAVGNQANLWLLVRLGYAEPACFLCPATADQPSLYESERAGAMGFLDLDPVTSAPTPEETRFLRTVAGGRCSYSYQNQFAHPGTAPDVTPAYNATTHWQRHPRDLAVLADRNPYTRMRLPTPGLLVRQPVVSFDDHPEANSLNHGGRGQNVLYLDGRVEWHETPRCGARRRDGTRDAIYTPRAGRPDDPRNIPRTLDDSFLVP